MRKLLQRVFYYQIKNYYLNYLCSIEESTKMNKRKKCDHYAAT